MARQNIIYPKQQIYQKRLSGNKNLLRKCTCGQHTIAGGECAACRQKRLQRKTASHTEPETTPPIVHEALRSSGQPLDAETRAFMEPRFGHDFSQVRVHTNSRAAEAARAVNALAYTVGQDIVFGASQYAPRTSAGQYLLAHELTHIAQQSKTITDNQRLSLLGGLDETTLENEAETQAAQIVNGHMADPISKQSQSSAVMFQSRESTPLKLSAIPIMHCYHTAVDTQTLEGTFMGTYPQTVYSARIDGLLHRHGLGAASVPGVSHKQDSDRISSSASVRSQTSLLIHQSIVRVWMREAYHRSNMGGRIPCEYLPHDVRRQCYLERDSRERLHLSTGERQEWGGIILHHPSGVLHCAFHTSGQLNAVAICPSELDIEDGHIGQSAIVGSFHTHPSPHNPPATRESPSSADQAAIRHHPECVGAESYVIGLDNIYVIFPDGAWQSLGPTNDWLWT